MAARCLLLVWVKSAKGIPQPRANVFQERGRCWGILPSGGAALGIVPGHGGHRHRQDLRQPVLDGGDDLEEMKSGLSSQKMILEDVSGRVVRTVSYNVEFDGDSREMCLYYTTKTGEPYSQDRRVFPKVLADGTYVYTLPRTQIVALRLDPCSPDENKTVGLTFTPQSITLNAASTLPGGADYFIPTWYQLFGLIVYPALAAAALDWLWAVGRQLAKKKQ